MQFTHLQANLSEIYAALHAKKDGEDLPLIATSSSTVYYKDCIVGKVVDIYTRAWKWIQPHSLTFPVKNTLELIVTTLFDHAVHAAYDARQRRIWNSMRQIDDMWKATLQSKDFKQQKERYAYYLDCELQGSVETNRFIYLADFDARSMELYSEQEEKVHRHTVINFHQATDFFWSLFTQHEGPYLITQALMPMLKPASTLTDRPLYEALKKERMWVEMEGIMQQAIPIALIAKLEGAEALTFAENRVLTRWVQALNCYQQSISPKLFSTVLHEIMSVIHLQGFSKLALPKFLFWLEQQGCELLFREDPEHMDWREGLSEGSKVVCNHTELTLGKQLSPEKEMDDRFKIFECKNYPNVVVKIANNRFFLLIEAHKAQHGEEHSIFRFVDTVNHLAKGDGDLVRGGLDNEGRCVIQEKLFSPLSDIKWLSQGLILNAEDEKCALVFANHLYCMLQWKMTLPDLTLTHLMWDVEGVLKSTRLLKKGDANYNWLESCCVNAAKGNLGVLNFLMRVSQLHQHPVGRYYREAVEYTLKWGEMDLIGHPLPLGHRQECYDQHVKKLCVEAIGLKENCFKKVVAYLRKENKYSYKDEDLVRKTIAEKLFLFYQVWPAPGQFPQDVEQCIVKSFDENKVKSPLLNALDAKDYYQEKHALMIKYNELVNKG